MSGVSIAVNSQDLADLAAAVKYEENGAALRRDLARNLRRAVAPAVTDAKASIMAMPSRGSHAGQGLRSAIARQVSAQTSLSNRSAKVAVRVRRRNFPRGFRNAPKAVSLAGGWRHPVVGSGGSRWVTQVGKPGWFDSAVRARSVQYRRAVQEAMQQTADRIAGKV